MYKETVKFFIRTGTKAAYPVLKGGKEDTAREWAFSNPSRRRSLQSIVNGDTGSVVEVDNLFHKIQVTDTESRGQGGKLFKCKLFLSEDDDSNYVILDLRNGALFSILTTGEFLGRGTFKGTYALSSTSGTYYILNLEDTESEFYAEYLEYLEIEERKLNNEEIKNELSVSDLIQGHVYTKVSKGAIEKRRYFYAGNIPVKDSEGKTTHKPTYFNVRDLQTGIKSVLKYSDIQHDYNGLATFISQYKLTGIVDESVYNKLANGSVLVKSSNKFYADVTEDEPLDLYPVMESFGYFKFRFIDALNFKTLEDTNAYGTKNLSESLVKTLKAGKNRLFSRENILYFVDNFKGVKHTQHYIEEMMKYIQEVNGFVQNYIDNFETLDHERLLIIKELITKNNQQRHFGNNESIVQFQFRKEQLQSAVKHNNLIIDDLDARLVK